MMFNKDAKTTQWGKDSLLNKWCWKNWISTWEKIKLLPYLITNTKINSKRIKDLNVGPNTMKPLAENIGERLLTLTMISWV